MLDAPVNESHEVQVHAAMVGFDSGLEALLVEGAQANAQESRLSPEQEYAKYARARQVGRAALIRGGLEVGGAVVDTLLLAGAKAGISELGSATSREMIATTGDVVVLDKVQGGEQEKTDESRLRRIGKKLGNIAIGVTTAVVAQKLGTELADRVHESLNSGMGEYAVPIASKVGAAYGVSALRSRLGS